MLVDTLVGFVEAMARANPPTIADVFAENGVRVTPDIALEGTRMCRRFDDDTYYRPSDDAMRLIATVGGLAQWRHYGKGPPFTKFGRRILYLGADLNRWMDKHRVEPTAPQGKIT